MNTQIAMAMLNAMKGKDYWIDGKRETVEFVSINGQTASIGTNVTNRSCKLPQLANFIKQFHAKKPGAPTAIPSIKQEPVKPVVEERKVVDVQAHTPAGVHVESMVKVFVTREYSRFKGIVGNRELNESKINRIIKDIESGLDMLPYCPVIVDEDMKVIDGQHRLFVAKKLKCNVWYVVAKTLTLHDIAKVNSNTEKWKPKDFLNCYVQQGNENYDLLQKYLAKYSFPLSISLQLLSHGSSSDGGSQQKLKEKFERGTFEAAQYTKAVQIAEYIKKYKSHSGYLKGSFIAAVGTLMAKGKCDMDKLYAKFMANPDELNTCSTTKEYLKAFEDIYNKHSRQREAIY